MLTESWLPNYQLYIELHLIERLQILDYNIVIDRVSERERDRVLHQTSWMS